MKPKPLCAQRAKELNLSTEQVRKIEEGAAKAREASQPLKAALLEARQALRQALAQPAPNEEEVLSKMSAVSAAKLELHKSHMRWMLSLRQELSVEQWEKLREAKVQKPGGRGKRGKWKQRGMCAQENMPAGLVEG